MFFVNIYTIEAIRIKTPHYEVNILHQNNNIIIYVIYFLNLSQNHFANVFQVSEYLGDLMLFFYKNIKMQEE